MAVTKRKQTSSGSARRLAENKPLSLYPLDLATALGAALQTGKAPDIKGKKTKRKPTKRSK